jgi:hypothetical protein
VRWLAVARRCALFAVLVVGAAVPWYALRMFPLVTVGTASINVLDALVAVAVALSLPAIGAALRSRRSADWAVLVFLVYMVVPFVLGPLRDHQAWFYAVREARALAFYALALAFAAGEYGTGHYRQFAAAYAVGAVAASVAVFVHLLWRIPLPGYPAMIASTPEFRAGIIARYLEWTVPVVAFLFCLAGTLHRDRVRARVIWAAGLCCTTWYLIAMHERTPELVALAVGIAVPLLPSLGGLTWRRVAIGALGLVVIAGVGTGVIPGPRWVVSPAEHMVEDWLHVAARDPSIRIRTRELQSALPTFLRHPIFGAGLGSIVSESPPDFPTGPWRYIAPGYGYLLVKTGIIGFALFFAMVGIAVRRGWASLRQDGEAGEWPRRGIAMVGIGALLALNLTHTVVDIPEGAIAFSLFYGMLIVGT